MRQKSKKTGIPVKWKIKRGLYLLFTLHFSLFIFSGCSKDGIEPEGPGGGTPGQGGDIRFEIGFASQGGAAKLQAAAPQTRVATDEQFRSTWEEGDEIGIFAVEHGEPLAVSGNHIHNVKLTYNSADGGSWSLDTGVELYFPPSGGKLDFYAYYPYDDNGGINPRAISFNVLTDQSGTDLNTGGLEVPNYNLSDLLTAKSDNSGAGWGKDDGPVTLQFSHALAMVEVRIPGGKGWAGGSDGLTVTLLGVQSKAGLNLTGASGPEVTLADTDNDPVNITMYRMAEPVDGKYIYRALVPAQDISQGRSLFWFDHQGRELLTDGALSAKVEMKAGQAEKFTRELPATMIEMVEIEAGTFMMGSPDGTNGTTAEPNRQSNETQHEVTLTQNFYMSRYPVTFAQYDAFCEATGANKPSDSDWGRGDRPVINVTWYNAVAYCEWVSDQTGMTCRLPTEAEWEYACRGGQSESLPFGIGSGKYLDGDMANFNGRYIYDYEANGHKDLGSDNGTYLGRTSPVGSYSYPNGFGLYDMHGNVFEWCLDQWDGWADYSSSSTIDPVGESGDYRVLQGGGWYSNARGCRSAFRNLAFPDDAGNDVGFRVVFTPSN